MISGVKLPDMSGFDLMMRLKPMVQPVPMILSQEFGWDAGHTLVKARQAGLHPSGTRHQAVQRTATARHAGNDHRLVAAREGIAAHVLRCSICRCLRRPCIGHFSIAVWLFNRLHAFALPRPAIKVLEKLAVLAAAIALTLLVAMVLGRDWFRRSAFRSLSGSCATGYIGICWLAAAGAIPGWLIPKLRERTPERFCERHHFGRCRGAAGLQARCTAAGMPTAWRIFPAIELLQIAVQQETLQAADPAGPTSTGLTIAHLLRSRT